jgi:hypothetical protein
VRVCVCVYAVPPPLVLQLELSYASLRTRETHALEEAVCDLQIDATSVCGLNLLLYADLSY